MPTVASGPPLRLEAALRAAGAPAWERSPRDRGGASPDLLWRHRELAVFVDGCAWHGCPLHGRRHERAGHGLSREGVLRQKHTDRIGRAALAATGVRVLTFWEHEVRADARGCAARILEVLGKRGPCLS